MESQPSGQHAVPVPVLLLKTQSTPGDSYHDKLKVAQLPRGRHMAPEFVPVMRHTFNDDGLCTLRALLRDGKISRTRDACFGGLIFTSQRAVEAFAHVVNSDYQDSSATSATSTTITNHQQTSLPSWPHLQDVPIYSVGPATTRALLGAKTPGPLQVFGQHTGNGAALAQYILDHYGAWYRDRPIKPPLLFLVGEQRRDVIPVTLMDPALAADRRIVVTEEVVYGTGVMESFPADFDEALKRASAAAEPSSLSPSSLGLPLRWVVVFSPTGCESMLRGLGMLDDAGRAIPDGRDSKTFIATIGPTTRDYLIDMFGFHPDVCATAPSPEGILEGITEFEARIASTIV